MCICEKREGLWDHGLGNAATFSFPLWQWECFIFSDSEPFHKQDPHKFPLYFWCILGVLGLFSVYLLGCACALLKRNLAWSSPEVLPVECSRRILYFPLWLQKHLVVLCFVMCFKWEIFSSVGAVKLLSLSHWGKNKWQTYVVYIFWCHCLKLPSKQAETPGLAGLWKRAPFCSLQEQVTVCLWFTEKLLWTCHQKAEPDAVCLSLSQYVCGLCFVALLPTITS